MTVTLMLAAVRLLVLTVPTVLAVVAVLAVIVMLATSFDGSCNNSPAMPAMVNSMWGSKVDLYRSADLQRHCRCWFRGGHSTEANRDKND